MTAWSMNERNVEVAGRLERLVRLNARTSFIHTVSRSRSFYLRERKVTQSVFESILQQLLKLLLNRTVYI